MAFPARGVGAQRVRGVLALGLMLCATVASADVTIFVNTNRDLADPNDGLTSLREAIYDANSRALSEGSILITFDQLVFASLGGGNWTHAQALTNPNTIVVGNVLLSAAPGYETDDSGQPLPLPPILRRDVKLKGELNNDGAADVRIDLTDVPVSNLIGGISARSYGLLIGPRPGLDNPSAAITSTVVEGFDLRYARTHATPSLSPPAILINSGTNHRVVETTCSSCAIGIETNIAVGTEAFIGGISSGSQNTFGGDTYAGVLCTGAGTTTIQNNTFSDCGNATDTGVMVSGGVVLAGTGDNVVGGTVAGSDNRITTSVTQGVVVVGSGNNFVQNNNITHSDRAGIWILGSGDNIIGGSGSQSGNTINSNGDTAGSWSHAGIYIGPSGSGGGSNTIQGNTIGGTTVGNGGAGIQIDADGDNRIGGTAVAARNVICGNGVVNSSESRSGIDLRGDGDNIIENNHIGVNRAGSDIVPWDIDQTYSNRGHGISIGAEASGNNTIGGTQSASRNVVSGNSLNGIRLAGTGDNVITGNYLGVSATGSTDLGNAVNGIEIAATAGGNPTGVRGNRIGGTSAAERNVISGNNTDGVTVNGTGQNLFYGNYIGIGADGSTDVGNGRHGISITTQALGVNTIGGREPGQRNVISGNGSPISGGFGVSIGGTPDGDSNVVRGNYIGINDISVLGQAQWAARPNIDGGVSVDAAEPQIIGGSNLGDGNIIAGNASDSSADGIELLGAGGHVVIGNVIGAVPFNPGGFPQDARLLASGIYANAGAGILIGGGSTGAVEIGRTGANEGNVIVNNLLQGVQIAGSGAVTVKNNLVGVGPDSAGALAAMGNGSDGILLSGSAANLIGGNEESPDNLNTNQANVISGNGQHGVNITGSGNNQIIRNRLGTDFDATATVTGLGNTGNGVTVTGTGNNALTNNTISGNTGNGVEVFTTGTCTLLGNTIGLDRLDRTGTLALANGGHGIHVPNNAPGRLVVGSSVAGTYNLVSGNSADGIHIEGNVQNDLVLNRIGTGADGTAAVPNGQAGVYLQGTATSQSELVENTISGNQQYGVYIRSGSNSLFRNLIGTDISGTQALGNGQDGVYINDPNLATERQGQQIGRLAAGNVRESNVISGNQGDGIHIVQAGGTDSTTTADDVIIHTNYIGVGSSGLNPIPNQGDGIEVASGCNGRIQIGGLTDGQGNVISANGAWGILYQAAFSYNPGQNINNAPLIYGNFVGTNVQGEQPSSQLANASGGVHLEVDAGSFNRVVPIGDDGSGTGRQIVGGRRAATNVISGNNGPGIEVAGTAGVTIVGCFIGTDQYGREIVANQGSGISVGGSVTGDVLIGVVNPLVDLPVLAANDLDDREPYDAGGDGSRVDGLPQYRNVVAGNQGWGIDCATSGNAVLANNHLGAREGSRGPESFDNQTGGQPSGGLRLAGGGPSVTGAAVDNNYLYDNGGTAAAVLTYSGPVLVNQNRVQRSAGIGLSIDGAGTYTISGNTISGNGGSGLQLGATTAVNGALIGSAAVDQQTVTGRNYLTDNVGDGLQVVSGTGNRFSANVIRDNGVVSGTYDGISLPIEVGNDGAGVPADFLLDRLVRTSGWVISGTVPTDTIIVELYEADDPDAVPNSDPTKHHGGTRKFLGRLTEDNDGPDGVAGDPVDLDAANGTFIFTAPLAAITTPEDQALITALATASDGTTTEFARNTGVVALDRSQVTVSPDTIASDGSQVATAEVRLLDRIDTPLQGVGNVVVTASPSPSTLTLDQDANDDGQIDSTTDNQGRVNAALTATDSAGSPITIGATVGGTQLQQTALLHLGVGAPSTTRSTIEQTPPNTTIPADGSTPAVLTITLRDGSGTTGLPVPDVAAAAVRVVQVDAGGAVIATTQGVSLTQPTTPTDANGQTTAKVVSAVVDADPSTPNVRDPFYFGLQLSGTLATGPKSIVLVPFGPGAPSATLSSFVAAPSRVQADGSSTATLSLQVLDANGNPVDGILASGPNSEIDVSASPATGVTFVTEPAATDASGQAVWTVASTSPATVGFVAIVRGVTLDQPAEVEFTRGDAGTLSSLTANPIAARPNGTDTINLTATVRDNTGNAIPGQVVNVTTAQGQGVIISGPDAPTNTAGQAFATATSTKSGRVVFQATTLVNNATVTLGTVAVDFRLLDPNPALSTLTVQTDDPLLANNERQATCTVTLLDELGDPIVGVTPGELVVTTTRQGTGTQSVVGPALSTDQAGQATFAVVSRDAGVVKIAVAARGVVLNQTVEVEFLSFITQSYGPGLHLMGIPGTPRNPDPRNVFSALLPGLKLARWDATQQQYRTWNEFSPTAPFALNAGRGFWLRLDSLVSLTTVGEASPAAPFQLALDQGWNQVANPFGSAFEFGLTDINVLQNGTPVGTLASSAGQQLLEPYGWRWDPVLQYLLVLDPTTAGASEVSGRVGVGQGWWWLCKASNVSVLLRPTAARSRGTRQTAPTPGSWVAALQATTAAGSAQAVFGAGSSRLRAAAPPASPDPAAVTLEFVDTAGRAASDVRQGPLSSAQSWQVAVTTRQAGEVQLSWQGLARALPSRHRLYLVDPTSGRRLVMNSRAGYSYQGGVGTRLFEVVLDPHGTRGLEIANLAVGAGRSRAAGVPVTVTLTADAKLVLVVRGASGRLVRQVEFEGYDGTNTLSWDGRDQSGRPVPAGSYRLDVTAYTAEGELARATRQVSVQ